MKPVRSRWRLFFRGIVVLLIGGLTVWVNHLANSDPGRLVTPIGKRDSALYVVMKDGTRIAIDVWLPPGIARDGQVVDWIVKEGWSNGKVGGRVGRTGRRLPAGTPP